MIHHRKASKKTIVGQPHELLLAMGLQLVKPEVIVHELTELARRRAKNEPPNESLEAFGAAAKCNSEVMKVLREKQESIDGTIQQQFEKIDQEKLVDSLVKACGDDNPEGRKVLTGLVSMGMKAAPIIACGACWLVLEALFGKQEAEKSVLEQVNLALRARDYRTFKADLDFAKNQIQESFALPAKLRAKKAYEVATLLDKVFWQVNSLLDEMEETKKLETLELMHMVAHLRLQSLMLQQLYSSEDLRPLLKTTFETYKTKLLEKSHIYGNYRARKLTWKPNSSDENVPDTEKILDRVTGIYWTVPHHTDFWHHYQLAWGSEMENNYKRRVDKMMEKAKKDFETLMKMAAQATKAETKGGWLRLLGF